MYDCIPTSDIRNLLIGPLTVPSLHLLPPPAERVLQRWQWKEIFGQAATPTPPPLSLPEKDGPLRL